MATPRYDVWLAWAACDLWGPLLDRAAMTGDLDAVMMKLRVDFQRGVAGASGRFRAMLPQAPRFYHYVGELPARELTTVLLEAGAAAGTSDCLVLLACRFRETDPRRARRYLRRAAAHYDSEITVSRLSWFAQCDVRVAQRLSRTNILRSDACYAPIMPSEVFDPQLGLVGRCCLWLLEKH
jgi:hypothetical protein